MTICYVILLYNQGTATGHFSYTLSLQFRDPAGLWRTVVQRKDMYVYIYIYIYICVYVCVYTYIYI